MRALAHITSPSLAGRRQRQQLGEARSRQLTQQAAPDYRLRVPPALQTGVALGLLIGLAGVVLSARARVVGLIFLAVGVVSGLLGGGLWIITSQHLRERARQRMLDAIAWRGDERVLDVGCGNGFLLVEIARHLTTGRATGVDLWKSEAGAQSPEIAWRNAHIEGVHDRIEIHNLDAREMPFDDHSFDVIVSSLMLHHAGGSTDRDQVVGEMLRVLKPDGALLLYDARPLITAAARRLRASGLTSILQSGWIMSLLIARRSPNPVEQAAR